MMMMPDKQTIGSRAVRADRFKDARQSTAPSAMVIDLLGSVCMLTARFQCSKILQVKAVNLQYLRWMQATTSRFAIWTDKPGRVQRNGMFLSSNSMNFQSARAQTMSRIPRANAREH